MHVRDRQGQGLRAGRGRRPRGHGALARREAGLDRQRRAGAEAGAAPKPANGQPPPPQYTKVFGDALVAEARRDERVLGITAAMNTRHRARHPPEGAARPLLRRRHRRAARGAVRRRARAAGREAGRRDLLDLPPARLRPDRPRRLPAEARRRLRDGPRRPRRRRRPDPPRRVRHLLPALPAEHGADGAARRGDARATCCTPRSPTTGPIALRYPRGEGEGVALPGRPQAIEIGRGEVLREGERVALLGYGYGVPLALGAADAARGRARASRSTVADARFAKPLDAELVERLAADHDVLVTVEENVLAGGFGAARAGAPGRPRPARRRAAAAHRPAGPLRHPRQAGAAARGGRADARRRRRARWPRRCSRRAARSRSGQIEHFASAIRHFPLLFLSSAASWGGASSESPVRSDRAGGSLSGCRLCDRPHSDRGRGALLWSLQTVPSSSHSAALSINFPFQIHIRITPPSEAARLGGSFLFLSSGRTP